MNPLDKILNPHPMYKLVLVCLSILSIYSIFTSILGTFPFSPLQAFVSLVVIVASCQIFNLLIGKLLKVNTNKESTLISALIIFLIFYPATNLQQLFLLVVTALLTVISKYILSINYKNLFNPVAIAAVILSFWPQTSAVWWVGSREIFPLMVIISILIVRKTRREYMYISFILASIVLAVINSISIQNLFISWPLLFLGSVMLTEPTTTPPTKRLQIIYGLIVGILFTSKLHLGMLFFTPELSLVVGNIFSYIFSPKYRYKLKLIKKINESQDTFTFKFHSNIPVNFQAGQYAEWTIRDQKSDSRGNRRYFTIASAPGSHEVDLGIKVFSNSSWYKNRLMNMVPNEEVMLSQISGDFVLNDLSKKYVFIAGGIGITPFRSMVLDLINSNKKIDIILIYANSSTDSIPYKDLFEEAKKKINLKNHYISQRLTKESLISMVSDYLNRDYYISGPSGMVEGYKKLLTSLNIPKNKIITDYFPGF